MPYGDMENPYTDLGLTYEEAAHGIQSSIAQGMADGSGLAETEPKHLRVGVDLSKSDTYGLATLLMQKGVFTLEEYMENMRLAANTELATHEAEASERFGAVVKFR